MFTRPSEPMISPRNAGKIHSCEPIVAAGTSVWRMRIGL